MIFAKKPRNLAVFGENMNIRSVPPQEQVSVFVCTVIKHYKAHGRNLPWRKNIAPYSIFVSEIMLQQTQVNRVLVKYPEFLKMYSDFQLLAQASLTEVLRLWQGMGYNRRAKYLHEAAQRIVSDHSGMLPQEPTILETLPGVGSATAGSIACFAYNKPTVFIETNIRRSILFHFFPTRNNVTDREVGEIVEACIHHLVQKKQLSFREWYWAIMDYGSYLKTVVENPNVRSKHYTKQSKFEGSDRQIRGKLLKEYLESGTAKLESARDKRIWRRLIEEGLVR